MAVIIRTKESFTTTGWSGGKTTELFIFPENSSVTDRNFNFRISTATVEIEETAFTFYTGYQRKLMVLQGELFLDHEDQHAVLLKPFDQDQFSGEWKTKGKGRVVDFNVIYEPNIELELAHEDIDEGGYFTLHRSDRTFMFIFNGSGTVQGNSFEQGDLVCVENEPLISIQAKKALKIILVHVKNGL